jgi:hypothetical protein
MTTEAMMMDVEELIKGQERKPATYYGQEIEDYLDLNFGAGTWVRDPYEDKYVVWTGSADGLSYVVIDRELRRFPVTIPASRLQ